MPVFERVGLITKRGDERVANTLRRLVTFLQSAGAEILLDADSARTLPDFALPTAERAAIGADCDLVIVVGGDGTFLSAARSLIGYDTRLIGVNLGRLGFLTDIGPEEMAERMGEIFAGRFVEQNRFLLHCAVLRDGKTLHETDALNEIVVHKWDHARLIAFDTYIDSRLVNSQRSDGMVVATPTGSTAYALSSGGPLLETSLDAMVLVPICPHTLSSRPLVVHGSSRIEIIIRDGELPEAQLAADGGAVAQLLPQDRAVITKRSEQIRLIHPPTYDYFATLRAKLLWSRGA